MKKLRVASIGGFGHSVFVFDEMVGMEEAELVAFAPAVDEEPPVTVTGHKIYHEGIRRFEQWPALLAEVRPDVVVISTRLDQTARIAMAAAEAGCHLICEKPLALTHESLAELRRTVERSGVKLLAMHTMRSLGAFVAARDLYQRGTIGDAVLANGRKSYKWGTRAAWFGRRETYGGTIGWVGIHALDFIHFITGVGYRSVMAMQSNFAHASHPDCEDNCALVLEMANGGHATVSVDLWRPSTAPTHGDDWVRVVGTRGVIEANASKGTCQMIAEGSGPADVPVPPDRKMFRNFLLGLAGKPGYPPELTAPDAFMLTHVCLCARDAADRGQRVEIDY